MSFINEEEVPLTHDLIKIASGQFDVSSVRILELSNLNIQKIENLDQCYYLEILDLSHNKITKIEGLENCTKLKRLNLSNNSISSLHGLEKLKQLEYLNMENNFIEELKDLWPLSSLPRLKSVNLKNNPVSQDEEYESTLKKIVKNISYIDNEHIILRMPKIVIKTGNVDLKIPPSKPWTIDENGESIFKIDEVINAEFKEGESFDEMRRELIECKKLIARADSVTESIKNMI